MPDFESSTASITTPLTIISSTCPLSESYFHF